MPATDTIRRPERRAAQGPGGSARKNSFAARKLIERLVAIRQLLAAAQGLPLTAEAMAEHFEVSRKTIYRDIETLRNLGAIKTWTDADGLNVHGFLLAEKSRCPFCGSPGKN
jgi:Fic family protein